jgi:DNA-binding phage protein
MPTSDSYYDDLILRLKDKSYAALYLETHLELEEGEKADSELLKLALSHVSQALANETMTPEQANLHQKKLDEIFSQPLEQAIYSLAGWLNVLGLKLTVTVAVSAESSSFDSVNNLEVPV